MASFQLQSHIEKITAKYIRIQSKNIYPTLSMPSFYRLNKYPNFQGIHSIMVDQCHYLSNAHPPLP